MSMKDRRNTVDSVLIGVTDAATNALTANLDCQDANYATIRVLLSAEANTNSSNVAIQISESDDEVATNFATFNANFNRTVDNTAAAVATSHIDLEGRKRYLRITVTPDTTTNGAVGISAMGTLYKAVRSADLSDYGDDVVVG
jgi:hypothetical protein